MQIAAAGVVLGGSGGQSRAQLVALAVAGAGLCPGGSDRAELWQCCGWGQ